MKARQLITDAGLDTSTRKTVDRAFDQAWSIVAKNYQSPLAVEAARLKLANILVSLAREGCKDPGRMADQAVRTFLIDDP
jgi:hypothetical protein